MRRKSIVKGVQSASIKKKKKKHIPRLFPDDELYSSLVRKDVRFRSFKQK